MLFALCSMQLRHKELIAVGFEKIPEHVIPAEADFLIEDLI
jgi:hypothetical protein